MIFPDPPIIIAHRGYSGRYPENTLPAFSAALESGAQGIELDITLSRDNHYMVIHDDTINRTTNASGYVHQFTKEELQQLDAGSWFDARFSNSHIPELSEVFDLIGDQLLINVEVKPQPNPTKWLEGLVKMITDYQLEDSVFLSSFDHSFLPLLAQLNSNIGFGLLYDSVPDNITIGQACSLHLPVEGEDWLPTIIKKTKDKEIPILVWTVNDPDQAHRLVAQGAAGIFTDYPAEMLEALKRISDRNIKT